MPRIKGTKSSAALLVAVVALVAALGGGAVAGVAVTSLNKEEKTQVKKISKKQAKKLDKKIELLPGPQGERGPEGPPGPSTGPAGGALSGSYPNPSIASGAVGPDAFGTIPAAKVLKKTTNQSIPDQTETAVSFNNESFDTADLHDESTLNSRLVAPIPGVYYVAASIRWNDNGQGESREIRIRKNGGAIRARNEIQPRPSQDTFQSLATLEELYPGEYLEVLVEQDSGGPLDVSLAVGTEATMYWVGPVGP